MKPPRQPLLAILKTSDLQDVSEHELPEEMLNFPECIELAAVTLQPDGNHTDGTRRFYRYGITDHRGFYREGVSYRISI